MNNENEKFNMTNIIQQVLNFCKITQVEECVVACYIADEIEQSKMEESSEFNEGYNECLDDEVQIIDDLITELYGADE